MSNETVSLADGRTVKLGRIRPKARPQCLAFSRYFFTSEMLTPPPAVLDWSAKAMQSISRVYRNDVEGDCVIAGKLHSLGVWSGNDSDSGGVVLATDAEAHSQYVGICGPGDNGCSITAVLDYMKSNGLAASGKPYKIDGYVSVDWRNKTEVQVALYLFGTLSFGINLPQAWLDAGDGGLWDVTNTQVVGGHDVTAVGYNSTGVVIATWGGLRTITWAAMASTQWLEECYAALAPLWYGSDKLSPCGVDAAKLAADLAILGGGTIPPIDPTPVPPPVPVPVPVPTPPPVPVPVPVPVPPPLPTPPSVIAAVDKAFAALEAALANRPYLLHIVQMTNVWIDAWLRQHGYN